MLSMTRLRYLLFPFSILLDAVTRLRNLLFDLKVKPSVSFSIPVIAIGNLAVGGTGKTPMAEYVIRLLLQHRIKTAMLSRGYGRATKGLRLANADDTPVTLGDEPFQVYQKYKKEIDVAVCEERAMAIPFLVDQIEVLQSIVLDDAFQHRYVRPGFTILLTDYRKPFYEDYLMPVGRLRESARGAKRADVIVVTKCPQNISKEKREEIEKQISKYTDASIYFAGIQEKSLRNFDGSTINAESIQSVVLVSGLAQSDLFIQSMKEKFKVVEVFDFRDHHHYTADDVEKIEKVMHQHQAYVITTEKDFVKLNLLCQNNRDRFLYLPIEMVLLEDGSKFDNQLISYIHQQLADYELA
jgi:tetraacyldisaccharide 4'-kinase